MLTAAAAAVTPVAHSHACCLASGIWSALLRTVERWVHANVPQGSPTYTHELLPIQISSLEVQVRSIFLEVIDRIYSKIYTYWKVEYNWKVVNNKLIIYRRFLIT